MCDHINTSVNQKPRPYRDALLRQLSRNEIDPPDRYSSGAFGQRKAAYLSRLAQQIKTTTKESELVAVLRGRSPCSTEQDLAIRQLQIIRSSGIRTSHSIVLKIDWTPSRPESAIVGTLSILEWRTRFLKDVAGKFKIPTRTIDENFVAVPEIWSKTGEPVPLHYHVMMQIPDEALEWFSETAHKQWMQVMKPFGLRGRIHVEPVKSQSALSTYSMKQADIDWVAQHILLPIDVEKYRNG